MDAPLDLRVKGAVLTDLLNLVGVARDSRGGGWPLTQAAAGAGGRGSGGGGSDGGGSGEAEIVRVVDEEFRRSRGGGWKRLHPRGYRDYSALIEPSRVRINSLEFADA